MPAQPETLKDASRLPEAGATDVVYLVDLSGYVFRAYHALPPLSSSKGEPTHAVLGTVNMLQKIVAERRPHMMAVAMDSKGPTFRHALDARYKATRPAPPPDLSAQMKRVGEVVRAWGVACFSQEKLEADDLIAALTARALSEGWRVVIVSADKDLMQLVRDADERVVLWDSMRDRVYGPAEVKAKLGVVPSRVRDFLALTGDTSDNVPGVPGVGPKTATDLLTQFGSLDGIFASLAQIGKAKLQSNLREHERDARLSLKLVTLDASVAIDWDKEKIAWGGANVVELRRLYSDLEFNPGCGGSIQSSACSKEKEVASSTASRSDAAPTEPRYQALLELGLLERIVAEARARGLLGLAVEATSSDAMRAEIVGLSLATDPGVGYYLPLRHRYLGCPPQIAWEQVRSVLAPALADPEITKVGHDLKRAAILLARSSAPLAGPGFDTLLGAYLLDPETPNGIRELARRELGVTLGRYEDTVAAGRGPHPAFDEIDVEQAVALAAARSGVALSLRAQFEPRLAAEGLDKLMRDIREACPLERSPRDDGDARCARRLCDALQASSVASWFKRSTTWRPTAKKKELAGRDFALRSRDQLEKNPVRRVEAADASSAPPKKAAGRRTYRRARGAGRASSASRAYSGIPRDRQAQRNVYRRAAALCRREDRPHSHPFRPSGGGDRSTVVERPELAKHPDSDRAWQNDTRGLHRAPRLRHRECRLFTDRGFGSWRTSRATPSSSTPFRAEDVHARTAALINDKARADVTSDERRAAKTINFGVAGVYGMGDSGAGQATRHSPRAGSEVHRRLLQAICGRRAVHGRDGRERSTGRSRAHDSGAPALPAQSQLRQSQAASPRGRAHRSQHADQGTTADILKLAMIDIGQTPATPGARMVLTVHDELVFEVPDSEADEAEDAYPRPNARRDEARCPSRCRRWPGQEAGRKRTRPGVGAAISG